MAWYGPEAAVVSGKAQWMVMTVAFQLQGQNLVALSGGPHSKFTETISSVVNCES